jgi:hypothetical protein
VKKLKHHQKDLKRMLGLFVVEVHFGLVEKKIRED